MPELLKEMQTWPIGPRLIVVAGIILVGWVVFNASRYVIDYIFGRHGKDSE